MLKGTRTIFVLEMCLSSSLNNEKLQSFKNIIEDKAEWVVQTVTKVMPEIWEKHHDCKSYPTN